MSGQETATRQSPSSGPPVCDGSRPTRPVEKMPFRRSRSTPTLVTSPRRGRDRSRGIFSGRGRGPDQKKWIFSYKWRGRDLSAGSWRASALGRDPAGGVAGTGRGGGDRSAASPRPSSEQRTGCRDLRRGGRGVCHGPRLEDRDRYACTLVCSPSRCRRAPEGPSTTTQGAAGSYAVTPHAGSGGP